MTWSNLGKVFLLRQVNQRKMQLNLTQVLVQDQILEALGPVAPQGLAQVVHKVVAAPLRTPKHLVYQ